VSNPPGAGDLYADRCIDGAKTPYIKLIKRLAGSWPFNRWLRLPPQTEFFENVMETLFVFNHVFYHDLNVFDLFQYFVHTFSTRSGSSVLVFHIMWIYTIYTFMLFCLDKGGHFTGKKELLITKGKLVVPGEQGGRCL